ncbi:hypothetical protein [Nocardia flavorosea]|uniref:Uncharacterized protein n=1 Tax=Nocardia flavorosea TaxID=53429 RepID=A0A846YR62_9NOCA|nr:hypothetical protein [Nocardia flavorosea]NKY59888.1 hypothetical protein [Nocardia flavorosea]
MPDPAGDRPYRILAHPDLRARLQRQLAITPSTAAMLTESARADESTTA